LRQTEEFIQLFNTNASSTLYFFTVARVIYKILEFQAEIVKPFSLDNPQKPVQISFKQEATIFHLGIKLSYSFVSMQ